MFVSDTGLKSDLALYINLAGETPARARKSEITIAQASHIRVYYYQPTTAN
jgi:hypothetical protein